MPRVYNPFAIPSEGDQIYQDAYEILAWDPTNQRPAYRQAAQKAVDEYEKQQTQGDCLTCKGSNYLAGLSPGFAVNPGRRRKDISDQKNYPCIKIYETTGIVEGTAVTIPGLGIFIHPSITNLDRKQTLQHEYGHYLDYMLSGDLNSISTLGPWANYMLYIGIPSAFVDERFKL